MPQTYSVDLRRWIVAFVERGHSRREAARVFDVSPSFVIILMRRYKMSGDLAGRSRGGARHDRLSRHIETLAEWIEADWTCRGLIPALIDDYLLLGRQDYGTPTW